MSDVVVIGAGLAGLTAALRLRHEGASVTLATFGVGGLPLSQGTLDVLGYTPAGERVEDPIAAIAELPEGHPYRRIGVEAVRDGLSAFAAWSPQFLSPPDFRNHVVPTAVGVLRPTCVVQPSMLAGDELVGAASVLVVGIDHFKDFHAEYVAANLQRSCQGTVRGVVVAYEARAGEADPTGLTIARSLDDPAARTRLADEIRPHVQAGDVVVMPAVLGNRDTTAVADLSAKIGASIVETPCLPPSVPGIRLNDHMTTLVKQARARWILGSKVYGGVFDGSRLTEMTLWSSGAPKQLRADAFVLATGGFESGGLRMDSYGTLSEPCLDLPVWAPEGELVHGDYLGKEMPLFRAGIRVDEHMRPLRDPHQPDAGLVAENLYAVGGLLPDAMRWTEKSGDGIAIGSAWKATSHILEGLK